MFPRTRTEPGLWSLHSPGEKRKAQQGWGFGSKLLERTDPVPNLRTRSPVSVTREEAETWLLASSCQPRGVHSIWDPPGRHRCGLGRILVLGANRLLNFDKLADWPEPSEGAGAAEPSEGAAHQHTQQLPGCNHVSAETPSSSTEPARPDSNDPSHCRSEQRRDTRARFPSTTLMIGNRTIKQINKQSA